MKGGDKILLPPSAFDTLARLNVDYPMLFQLQSPDKGTLTHCGVLEFTAEEGSIYIPFWMMQNLLITEGSLITVTNVSLPKATFVKLQPQHVDFLEISNPRVVLEHALRNFSCVTKGDVICVPYNRKNYHFELKEVKPKDAACIIETDCNVDFDAPVGYKDPSQKELIKSNSNEGAKTNTDSSTNGGLKFGQQKKVEEDVKPKGIQIVDGKIIRPDELQESQSAKRDKYTLAERIGGTGVQKNSYIPVLAPAADYWAISAGNGGRLDGKSPTQLKDKEGNVIDVSNLRTKAEEKIKEAKNEERDKAFAKASSSALNTENKTGSSHRKSRVGNKYSRKKGVGTSAAFGGKGNQF